MGIHDDVYITQRVAHIIRIRQIELELANFVRICPILPDEWDGPVTNRDHRQLDVLDEPTERVTPLRAHPAVAEIGAGHVLVEMDDRHVERGLINAFGRGEAGIRAQGQMFIAPIVGARGTSSSQQGKVERQLVDLMLMRDGPAVRQDAVAALLLAQIRKERGDRGLWLPDIIAQDYWRRR